MIPDWPRQICLCRDKLVGVGGAERVFVEQAATLVRRGVRCTIVLFELAESFREQLPREADIVVMGDGRYRDVLFLPKLLKLSRLLRSLRPDCVIAHQSLGDYLCWALRGTGIPYFLLRYSSVFYQAYDTTKYAFVYRRGFQKVRNSLPAYTHEVPARWQAGPLRRLVNESYAVRDWLGVRGARRLFTLSSQGQWELQQLYGVRAVIWTPGSAQASRIPPRDEGALRTLRHRYGVGEGQPVILSVNRLEYRKRIHVLIDGLRMLSTQGPRPKLVIVGDGEQRGALERQVRDAGLSEQVEFAGLVSEASLAHHYHMCDVAVAIIWGSWALSIVEPLLYNKRLVISDEIPDLLQGVPNLFRAAPEPEAVARGLEQALSSVALNSGDVIRLQLDWDSQVDKLLAHVRAGVRGAASHS